MKKTIEIEIPEGYNDAKYNPETGKVEFTKEIKRPKTWEEFCENYPMKVGECFIEAASTISTEEIGGTRRFLYDRNMCANKEEAKAFLALMQLRQLRKAWVGDWEPCYEEKGYYICVQQGIICVQTWISLHFALSFPDEDMAEDFLSCFKDLCKTAKILL